jgi:hypothetical protein
MEPQLETVLLRQNRLLKGGLALSATALLALFLVAAKPADRKTRFTELDVERINVVRADGTRELVITSRDRLPRAIVDGKEVGGDRHMPGIIFYNGKGDECGGLIYDGKPGTDGNPSAGVHLSMDRFGGDQQLVLAHYEGGGNMETGLSIYDGGLTRDFEKARQDLEKAPAGPERQALEQKLKEAGQTARLFVGRTAGRSSALVLADAKGQPRIMMVVTPEGKASLQFLGDKGEVIQTLPAEGNRP